MAQRRGNKSYITHKRQQCYRCNRCRKRAMRMGMVLPFPTRFMRDIRRIPPPGFQTNMSPQETQIQPQQQQQQQQPQQMQMQGRPPRRPQGNRPRPMMQQSNMIPMAANAVKSKMKNMSARDVIYLVKMFL